MSEKKNLLKITYTSDPVERTTQVTFKPKPNKSNVANYVESLVNGTAHSLQTLLQGIRTLRPVTQEEQDANCYIFESEAIEKGLFRARKEIYDRFAEAFSTILSEAFPDIEYINACRAYYQEFVLEHTPEEIEEYQQQLEAIAKKIHGGETVGPIQ